MAPCRRLGERARPRDRHRKRERRPAPRNGNRSPLVCEGGRGALARPVVSCPLRSGSSGCLESGNGLIGRVLARLQSVVAGGAARSGGLVRALLKRVGGLVAALLRRRLTGRRQLVDDCVARVL